jgi:hypothetical protein
MSRVYTVEFENAAITAANGDYDLFELTPSDDRPIKIIAITLDVLTELGDAQEEILRYRVIRGHTTSGNGTATTPRPVDPRDAAAGFTAETVGSTIASSGTVVNLHSGGFNVRVGERLFLPDKCSWKADQGDTTIVVRLMAAVADDLNMSGTLYVEEA